MWISRNFRYVGPVKPLSYVALSDGREDSALVFRPKGHPNAIPNNGLLIGLF